MAAQWPAPTYTDGDLTTAQPCGLPIFSSPIPGTTAEYVFTQDFIQFRANVSALAIGTAHPSSGKTPDYSSYVLVNEGTKQDIGNGLVRWERTYAAVPASHDEWESYAYNFIGTSPVGALSANYAGRFRFTQLVTSRVQHDYFYINPSIGTETADIKTSAGNIPTIPAFAYVQQYVSSGTTYGGIEYKADYVNDTYLASSNVGTLLVTLPSASQYAAMIQDAAKNGWNAGVSWQKLTDAAPPLIDITGAQTYPTTQTGFTKKTFPTITSHYGQIVAEDSRLSRWMGNIYLRQTRLVLAI